MKRFLLLLLVCFFALTGCGQGSSPEGVAQGFLEAILEREFEAAYQYLSDSAKEKISLEEFSSRYAAIFDGLGVVSIDYANGALQEERDSYTYTYSTTYNTTVAESLQDDYTMQLSRQEDGSYKIAWTPALIFPDMDWEDTVRVSTIAPKRGEIFASDSTLLAENADLYSVYVLPDKFNTADIPALASLLGMDATEIQEELDSQSASTNTLIVLKTYAKSEMTQEMLDSFTTISGVGVDLGNYAQTRSYPLSEYMAHTVGYVGKISEEEYAENFDQGYTLDSFIGKEGLEKAYEDQLKGTPGKEVFIRAADGTKKKTLYKLEAQNGLDLRLSIDIQLQKTAYDAFAELLTEDQSGVAIVLDYETGAVQTICNYPSFDANQFVNGISTEYWNSLTAEDSNQPLLNRATSGLYPPGSTFKPFTACFALDDGVITESSNSFNLNIVNNQWTPEGDWSDPAIRRIDAPEHGMNLIECMQWSDNIYFAKLALEIGDESFLEHLEAMGFTREFPFDLPVATSRILDESHTFHQKMLADSGYGQGDLLMTPIQLASSFASLANGGKIMVPYVVSSLCQADGIEYNTIEETTPEVWIENFFSQEANDVVQTTLRKVIESGTGRTLNVSGVTVNGKTGTGKSGEREIGWFAGYWVDGDSPRLVLVMVEGEEDTTTSAKIAIARRLLQPQTEETVVPEGEAEPAQEPQA